MNINVNGTVDELIAFAELLKAGKKAQEPEKPIEPQYQDNCYLAIAIADGVSAAIKQCRRDHATGELSTINGAKDYVEALLAKAVESGRVVRNPDPRSHGYSWRPMSLATRYALASL